MSSFCHTLFNEEINQVHSQYGRLVFKSLGHFMFVAHCDNKVLYEIVEVLLRDLGMLLQFIFGPHEKWDHETLQLDGTHDLFNLYLVKGFKNPGMIVGGTSKTLIPIEISDRIDNLLRELEVKDEVIGNGSMIIIGESVLHSRFSLHDTRMILQYYNSRPLGSSLVRFTPIYTGETWKNLYFIKLGTYILVVMSYIDKTFTSLSLSIEEFRIAFVQSRLEIPSEQPPVFLRLFAKRETLAMLYHNIKTGQTIFPQLRPGPEIQQKEISETFWTLFSMYIQVSGTNQFSLCKDQYRFYACTEGVHQLYLLMSAETVPFEAVPGIAKDILKNIKFV